MLAIISHPDCLAHDTGPAHPECASRIEAIGNQLITSGLDYVSRHYDAPKATRPQIERVHTARHLDTILAAIPDAGHTLIDGDTVVSPRSWEAAERAAGAAVLGVDLLMRREAAPVFCMVRPPGHHAEPEAALGFCLFNNVAIAAAHALEAHGLSRVAIIDFDAHHCNGTEAIFRGDGRVMICSSFQHPFYPFSGVKDAAKNLLSIPLKAGANGALVRREVTERWLPILDDFAPELVVVSAGFDGHVLDEMSALCLVEQDYWWISSEIRKLADRHAEGRILSVLEGGYDQGSLARSVVAHLRGLTE